MKFAGAPKLFWKFYCATVCCGWHDVAFSTQRESASLRQRTCLDAPSCSQAPRSLCARPVLNSRTPCGAALLCSDCVAICFHQLPPSQRDPNFSCLALAPLRRSCTGRVFGTPPLCRDTLPFIQMLNSSLGEPSLCFASDLSKIRHAPPEHDWPPRTPLFLLLIPCTVETLLKPWASETRTSSFRSSLAVCQQMELHSFIFSFTKIPEYST